MSTQPVFTITYWGVTGTFCDPLLPKQVTDKLVDAIALLAERKLLSKLDAETDLREAIRKLLEAELPLAMRSTYGGNTTCVELQTPDALLILDCGSGFRELGQSLDRRWADQGDAAIRSACILLTHAHIDHTFATPYFSPYYDSRNAFTIFGPQATLDSLTAVLDAKSAMSQIYFPPTYSEMKGIRGFRRIEPGADRMLGSTRITTYRLKHPGGSMAYRFENAGRVFVFATDHEHEEVPDPGLMEFARGADLFYTEGQYTKAEYSAEVGIGGDRPMSHRGWGHSPVESCIATALAAGVHRLHIGHRDPRRNDEQIAEFETNARELLKAELQVRMQSPDACELLIPYEGMQVHI